MTTTTDKAMPLTIDLVAPKGGQGTSTVAVSLALHLSKQAPTIMLTDDVSEAAAIIGYAANAYGDPFRLANTGLIIARTRSDAATIEGIPSDKPVYIVRDIGNAVNRHPKPADVTLAVLRGPCYLGVRKLAMTTGAGTNSYGKHKAVVNGIVVLAEQGRALTEQDIEAVTAVPVIATINLDPSTARAIDAGLYGSRTNIAIERAMTAITRFVPAPARQSF